MVSEQNKLFNLNHIINCSKSDITKLVKSSENYLKKQLIEVTREICSKNVDIKVVCIAGPSCAGKTTFMRMLCEKMVTFGAEPIMVSTDNFYIDRDKTPFLEDGVTRDFESLRALNLRQMNECFHVLRTQRKCKFPIYDFVTGKNIPEQIPMTLTKNTVIVMEGIHALNPEVISALDFKNVYKIFISPNSSFVLNKKTVITGEQLRFMRRITRDRVARGYSPEKTYLTWPNVLAAEQIYINKYKYTANAIIDTTHAYELVLYKYYLYKTLAEMNYSAEALYLHYILKDIKGYSKKIVPDFSLMWEFMVNKED